jgi:hypothetical protein
MDLVRDPARKYKVAGNAFFSVFIGEIKRRKSCEAKRLPAI